MLKKFLRSFVGAAFALGLGAASASAANSGVAPFTAGGSNPVQCNLCLGDYNTLIGNINTLLNGLFGLYSTNSAVGQIQLGGVLYTAVASSSTGADSTEDLLGTYSLPANSFDQIGRRVHVHASFAGAANGDTKTYKIYWGTTAISTGAQTNNNSSVTMDYWAVKTGSGTQNVSCEIQVGTLNVSCLPVAATQTDTAAITIKATGQDGSSTAGGVFMTDFAVYYAN